MNNLRSNTKLMFILFVSIFIVILVSLYSILSIRTADRNIVSIYKDRILPLEQLKSVSDAYIMDVIGNSHKALYGRVSWDSTVHVLNKAKIRINENWSDYLNTYLTPEESFKVQQTKYLKVKADEEIEMLIRILKEKNSQNQLALKQTVEDNLYRDIEPFTQKIGELIFIQAKEANNLKSLTEKVFNKIILLTILVTTMCFLMIWLFRYKDRLEKIILKQANDLTNANDELNAANEELLATNEELDATNEELYSTNEEYMMLNEQLETHKNHLELMVTERVKELKESEDRYRTLVDNIMIPFIVSTFEGEILFVNPKAIDFTGANPNELQTFRTTRFWVDPLKRLSLLEQVKTNGFAKNEEVQLYNSLGEKTTVILSSNLINYYGQTAFFTVFNDISERKKAENALQESEILYKSIVNSTSDLIYSVEVPNFRILTFNQELYEYQKLRNVNLKKGMTLHDIYDPELAQFWLEIYKKTLNEENVNLPDYMSSEGDRHYNFSLHLLKRDEEPFAISVFGHDITEIKKKEIALAESQIKLNSVIESTNDLIWAVDSEQFKIIAFNSAIKNEFIVNHNKVMQIGLRIEDLMPESYIEFWYNAYKRVLAEGSFELEYVSSGSKTLYLAFNLLKRENKVFGISVFGRNITESKKAETALKESEERFRVTFEKAGTAIALVDMAGKPIKSNPKLREMLGYSEEELAGMTFTEFTHPDDINKDWDYYTHLIKGVFDSYQIEKRYIRKDGGLVWGNLTVSLVRSPDGKPLYAIGMVDDITHKKDTERQILNSVINTEEHERLHFSQELHDGLGPLISAIKMYVQLLALPNTKMKPAETISNIEKLIEEASNSIREISFKLSPHVLLNYGIIEALNSYIEKVKESNQIAVELTSENFCRFSDIIETILYRVICECINNTIKHARAKKINIKIKCVNDEIDIIYKDDGQGFDVGKAMEEHKGIGLMNMQSRIKSVNGIMNIDSKPKQGVTIGIKLQAEVIKNIS